MIPGTKPDAAVKCPECGAQLVVNLRGHRQFTCGREDIYLCDDRQLFCRVVSVFKPCHTSEIAAEMAADQEREGSR
jgi:hypothetical protein